MASPEYYIRNASDTEARGPYNVEQLISMGDAGQITLETLVYDAATEQWVALSAHAEIKAAVFPEKKKLTIKREHKVAMLNKEDDSRPAITVDDMLAAAEGRSADTKDKADPGIAMARAAAIGRWSAIAMLVISAIGEIVPSLDALISLDPVMIFSHPLGLLGALDLGLAVLLGLGVVTLYPFVRFRAALGFGFLGLIFWTQGNVTAVVFLAAGCAGLYCSTIFVGYVTVLVAAALGLGGLGLVAWRLISGG